jgi:hypothetical protein
VRRTSNKAGDRGGVAVFAALALFDAQQHARAFDVGDFDGDGFGDAQSGAEAHHQRGAVLDAGNVLEEAADLVGAGHDGQFFLYPGARKVLLVPRHFQRVQIQELNGGNERVDALGGEFALLEHVQLVLAYGLQVELLGAAVEIAGEIGHIMDIASLGGKRKVAQLHVFDETLP